MKEIVNNFWLAGNKFMPEIHLRSTGFFYSTCEPFTKNKEKKLKKQEIQNESCYPFSRNIPF